MENGARHREGPIIIGRSDLWFALNNNEDSAMDEQSTDSDEPISYASLF